MTKKTAWFVDANDETKFLEALKESLAAPTETIRENAYSLVTQNYSNESISKRFLEFYFKMIKNNN